LLLRTGGTPGTGAPATLGKGFVIDNLTLRSGLVTGTCTQGACDETANACVVVPANEGGTCSDGALCTTGDVCQSGTCVGTPVTWTAADQCHVAGTCEPATGVCTDPPSPNGTSCS